MEVPKKASFYLKGLNGLRGIGALSIVISHTLLGLDDFGIKSVEGGWVFGSYLVTMFFTLSGFLITSLLIKEHDKFGSINIKDFYTRRVLRIWPLYYLYLIIAVVVLYFYLPHLLPGSIFYYVFLGANVSRVLGLTLPLFTHYWSLGVEEQFYLIWPWLFKKFSPLKAVTTFLVIFFMIKLALRIAAPNSYAYMFFYWTEFDCIAMGALFSIIFYNYNRLFSRICFNVIIQIMSWSVWVLAGLGWLRVYDFINHNVFSLATGVIVINVAFNKNSLIKLENKFTRFIGKISYGIYVYHVVIIFLLGKLLIGHLPVTDSIFLKISIVMLVLSTTVLTAYLSYNLFEKKFLNLKTKFTRIYSGAS